MLDSNELSCAVPSSVKLPCVSGHSCHLSLLRSVKAALPSLKCLNLMTQTLLFTVMRLAYTLRISEPLCFLLAF